MVMSRPKKKKAFFKIKEKLVFVSPKKFLARKIIGIIFLISGSLILAASLIYFYLLPRFFPPKNEIIKVREGTEQFSSQRVLIPSITLDLKIGKQGLEGKMLSKVEKLTEGTEIFVLGKESYRIYKVISQQAKMGSVSPTFVIEDHQLNLILPTSGREASFMSIQAELE